MGKDKKITERQLLAKKINRLLEEYTNEDFVGQLDLIAGLAGYNKISEMNEFTLNNALDDYFDQSEINDLFIDVKQVYEAGEEE